MKADKKVKLIISLISLALVIVGVSVIVIYSSWQVAAAVIALIWADNISRKVT